MILQKHIIDNTDRTDMAKFYEALKVLPCGRYEVYTCSTTPTRSDRQRKYYFGVVVSLISSHTGYSKEEVNELLKLKFNLKEIQDIDGKWIKFGGSIEKERKGRVEEIYAAIRQWAAENMDLSIPEPHEVPNSEYVKLDNEG